MRKASRKIISSISQNQGIYGDLEDSSSTERFYQRMLDRDVYLHLSEISVEMIAICLAGVSILNIDENAKSSVNTYVDDLLALDSFVFLTSYLISYWVVRVMTKSDRDLRKIGNIGNTIFLIGMVFMAILCGYIVVQGDYSL